MSVVFNRRFRLLILPAASTPGLFSLAEEAPAAKTTTTGTAATAATATASASTTTTTTSTTTVITATATYPACPTPWRLLLLLPFGSLKQDVRADRIDRVAIPSRSYVRRFFLSRNSTTQALFLRHPFPHATAADGAVSQ